ncbi:GNAT family N-acetyltransferase [Luteimonas sp. SX5]|uniref:GNAT family N-acetyltransferase n=1 Tax=Luteimonas galliterrae TaxID=2940486 RepID=A0ABT0MGG9_9GAMM|nr:GNAT family N-acetyltransferase [Luteimonas galliterrae]MCL1633364.1 GNAT family N-acetyltransferase [Luteimonas galliterrae]
MAKQIVKTATASDEEKIVAVVLLAFSTDPAARWTWPDPEQYLRHFPSFVKALGGKAYAHQSAYCVDGYAGAALWLAPGVDPGGDTVMDLMQRTAPEPVLKDVLAVVEQMSGYHPQEPHWYLPFIAVDPPQQGKGYGAALMEHALIPCDRDRTLAYLESSNPQNIPLYERHGFELLGEIQVGRSPPIFPMLRKPR